MPGIFQFTSKALGLGALFSTGLATVYSMLPKPEYVFTVVDGYITAKLANTALAVRKFAPSKEDIAEIVRQVVRDEQRDFFIDLFKRSMDTVAFVGSSAKEVLVTNPIFCFFIGVSCVLVYKFKHLFDLNYYFSPITDFMSFTSDKVQKTFAKVKRFFFGDSEPKKSLDEILQEKFTDINQKIGVLIEKDASSKEEIICELTGFSEKVVDEMQQLTKSTMSQTEAIQKLVEVQQSIQVQTGEALETALQNQVESAEILQRNISDYVSQSESNLTDIHGLLTQQENHLVFVNDTTQACRSMLTRLAESNHQILLDPEPLDLEALETVQRAEKVYASRKVQQLGESSANSVLEVFDWSLFYTFVEYISLLVVLTYFFYFILKKKKNLKYYVKFSIKEIKKKFFSPL